MSEAGGGDSPPRPVRRRIRKVMVVSSTSDSDSDESVAPSGTRRKRLRVLSDDGGESSGSSVVARRRRTLRALRDSEAESDSSGWATDHSGAAAASGAAPAVKKQSGFSSDSSEGNSDKCSICLLRFKDQEVGIPEACEHMFCLDCITEWSKNVNTCPVDRMTFNSITVRICAGGRVLRTEPVVVTERRPSVDIFVVEDPTPCEICGSIELEETMLLCDGCDMGYHLQCLTPPLTEIPEEQWMCPNCSDLIDDVIHISELDDLFTGIVDIDLPVMARSVPLREPRNVRRSARNSQADEPSTSTGRRGQNPDMPSTSGATSSRAPSSRSRSTVPSRRRATHRRKRRRPRTVVIEYELEENGKFPVTRTVKKRVKKRKMGRKQRTAARRSHVRASVRAKLATHLDARVERSQVSSAGPGVVDLSINRRRAGIPALNLFGNPNQLEYFSDSDCDVSEGATSVSAVATRPTSSMLSAYRQARRKMVSVPSPPYASSAPDLLSSIMESQTLLHSKRSIVSIAVDGKVDIKLESRAPKKEETPNKERIDPNKGEGTIRKTPSYPGHGRTGGWGGGYRGNYHRENPTGNFSQGYDYSAQAQPRPQAGPGPGPQGNEDHNNYDRRSQHYDDRFDRRRQDTNRNFPPENNRNFQPGNNRFPPENNRFPQENNRFPPENNRFPAENRFPPENNRFPPENNRFPAENNRQSFPADNRQFQPELNRTFPPDNRQNFLSDNRNFRPEGRASTGGPSWHPFGPRPQRPEPPARNSFGGFENPLDMRTSQPVNNCPPEEPQQYQPLPEPPSFKFDRPPEVDKSEDENDSGLIIDTEKYDPMEPTNDEDEDGDEDGDEDSPPVVASSATLPQPPLPPLLQNVLSSMPPVVASCAPLPQPLPPPLLQNVLSSIDASAINVSAEVLDDAVRQVIQEHRNLMQPSTASHRSDASEEESDGDCPNFSIYSATSVHIAEIPRETPPIKHRNIVQEVEDIPAPHPESPRDNVESTATSTESERSEPTTPNKATEIRNKEQEFKEKVSKRCPITISPRNPIKIKLNTPSLIKRQVSLYDDEDVGEDENAVEEPTSEAENESSPEKQKHSPKSKDSLNKESIELNLNIDEELEDKVDDFPDKDEEENESFEDKDEASDDVTSPKLDDEAPSDINGEVRSKADDGDEEKDDDDDDKEPVTADSNKDEDEIHSDEENDDVSEKELQPHKDDEKAEESVEKMTESISETEDERSYTPCLDENKSKDTSLETEKEKGIEGLDTEMISEEEGNDIFSDNERTKSPTEPVPEETGKKKKKKETKNKDKAKGKSKKTDVAFKKLSKSGKERNYRDKDKEEKKSKKERRSSESVEERRARRREKRKDLERYDVRTLVTERRRRGKDAFGRDVSPPRDGQGGSPLGDTPRRSSASPRRRSPSLSPRRRSISPRRRSISPRRRSISPRRRSISPRRKSISPRRRTITPRRRTISPRRRSISPRRRSLSKRSISPKGKPVSIRRRTISPRRKSISPRRKSVSPRRKAPSPRRRSTSRGRKISARRRRSTSRARKRVRRSASKSPKPKKKKKRVRSTSRQRSPRRKTPKKKRVRPSRSPSGVEGWSPASVASCLLSPRTPPPRHAHKPRAKHKRSNMPGPSKEVFTSGDNILVSVSFKDQERSTAGEKRKRKEKREKRRKRKRMAAAEVEAKPVAIIDLDRSPFREITPSPKNVIVLSDSDHGGKEPVGPAPAPAPEPEPCPVGPKTPPEPAQPAVKFTLAVKPAPPRPPNPLGDDPAGPTTPPGSPDAYDPFEPTRSPSPEPAEAPRSITLETAQKTNLSADDVIDRRPISPMEKVMALLQSTRDISPDPPPQPTGAIPVEAVPTVTVTAAVPVSTAPTPLPTASAAPAPRIVLPSPTRSQPPKLFLAKPSPIKSNPVKPMQVTKISRLPLPTPRRPPPDMEHSPGADSPYSPGSSDFGDLFSPPGAPPAQQPSKGSKRDVFDALFDKPPKSKKSRSSAAKVPVKLNRKKGKTQIGVKIDEDNLKILDDLPSSAVEMQVKSKFLKKLNRQERVVEEVKLVLKPHYNKKHVTKEEYKDILRRCVPKICHNKSGEINPTKIQAFVEAYVKKYRKKHKTGAA